MKEELKTGSAILVGYYLGKHNKFRTAAALALMLLAGRLRGEAGLGGLLDQAGKLLGGTAPDLGKVTGSVAERVRGDLVEAGKSAAKAAASRRIDALSDRLHRRAEALRHPEEAPAEAEEAGAESAQEEAAAPEPRIKVPRPRTHRAPEPEPGDLAEEELYEEEPEEYEAEERPAPPRRTSKPVTRRR